VDKQHYVDCYDRLWFGSSNGRLCRNGNYYFYTYIGLRYVHDGSNRQFIAAAVTGNSLICLGSTASFSDATAGGTWSSGNTAVATIDTFSGVLSSIAQGTATITYALGAGCSATKTVTVNSIVSVITGVSGICALSTTVYSDTAAGGAWSSSNTAVATIGSGDGITSAVSFRYNKY